MLPRDTKVLSAISYLSWVCRFTSRTCRQSYESNEAPHNGIDCATATQYVSCSRVLNKATVLFECSLSAETKEHPHSLLRPTPPFRKLFDPPAEFCSCISNARFLPSSLSTESRAKLRNAFPHQRIRWSHSPRSQDA